MTDLRTWLADMLVTLRQSASKRELIGLSGEHRIEARRSSITLRDGVVIGCEGRADGKDRAPSIIPLAPQSMTRVDLATAV